MGMFFLQPLCPPTGCEMDKDWSVHKEQENKALGAPKLHDQIIKYFRAGYNCCFRAIGASQMLIHLHTFFLGGKWGGGESTDKVHY